MAERILSQGAARARCGPIGGPAPGDNDALAEEPAASTTHQTPDVSGGVGDTGGLGTIRGGAGTVEVAGGVRWGRRRKNPPEAKLFQAALNQPNAETASQRAHSSIAKRYHQIDTEKPAQTGRVGPSLRAWNQRRRVLVEPLPRMNILGFPKRPALTAKSKIPTVVAVSATSSNWAAS